MGQRSPTQIALAECWLSLPAREIEDNPLIEVVDTQPQPTPDYTVQPHAATGELTLTSEMSHTTNIEATQTEFSSKVSQLARVTPGAPAATYWSSNYRMQWQRPKPQTNLTQDSPKTDSMAQMWKCELEAGYELQPSPQDKPDGLQLREYLRATHNGKQIFEREALSYLDPQNSNT